MQEAEKIWMNGALVDWADARVHVLSHGLHYGTTVFEGIRAYDADGGTAVFRLDDHLPRLERSAADVPHAPAVHARRDAAGGPPGRSRPTASAAATSGRSRCAATAPWACSRSRRRSTWRWPPGSGAPTSGEEGLRKGIRAKISSWRRIGVEHHPGDGQGRRPVPQLDPRQDRVAQGRLPGGHPPQRGRLRGRRLRREPLPGARRGAGHAAGARVDPRGHHAGQHHRAGRRRGHPGGRARGRPGRALHGRRGLHHRDRRRGLPGERDRRPRARPARPGHAPAAGALLRRHRRAATRARPSGWTTSRRRRRSRSP